MELRFSEAGGRIEFRANHLEGPILAECRPESEISFHELDEWRAFEMEICIQEKIESIYIRSTEGNRIKSFRLE